MVSVHQRYGRTDRRTDVTCRQHRPMHARAVKTHMTGSIEQQRKVFIHAVHARLTTTNMQMSCLGSRAVVRTMAPTPFYSFALWLFRLLPDLLLCLTGSPPGLFAPKGRNQTDYLQASAKKYSLKLFAIISIKHVITGFANLYNRLSLLVFDIVYS